MHSNFIIPPDYIKSVLIIDATEEQIQEVANLVQGSETPYNIYLYDNRMNDRPWMLTIHSKVDAVLKSEECDMDLPAENFGPTSNFRTPAEYFTKNN